MTFLAARLSAQIPESLGRWPLSTVAFMGSSAEDAWRLDQLRGSRRTAGWMLRAGDQLMSVLDGPAKRVGRGRGCDFRWAIVAPRFVLTRSSRLPFERNDNGVWSGRGYTSQMTGGIRAECGRLRVVVAPDVWHAQNRAFPILPPGPDRSFANPFYLAPVSADLPIRFGSGSLTVVQPGQSSVEVDAGMLSVGFGSQPQWWGPGVRNGIVMSNHAAGIPSAYVRTTRPVRSRWGSAEARWIVGALTESPFYDRNPANDLRSVSGLVITATPAFDTAFTVGVSRVVYAPIPGVAALPARFLDAVARWGPSGNVRVATSGRAAEQLSSLFARWVVPSAGVEAYGEWARVILPASLRSLLLAPQYTQGYTLGSQWLNSADSLATAWRVHVEMTMLEQPRVSRSEEPPSFYDSPVVGQGYTQRGRLVGALVGPGGSGQILGVDRLRPRWSAGVEVGRIRWNNEQYYRRPTGNLGFAHDVSLYGGLRGSYRIPRYEVSAELVAEKRLNYLFQSAVGGYGEDRTFDVANASFRFALTPR